MLSELPRRVDGCRVTGHPTRRLPGHASFVFEGIEIASVLLGLDRRDIWASSGSACTSASSEPSHVLVAMGVPREWVFGALRLTFGLGLGVGVGVGESSMESGADVETLLEAIPPLVFAARTRLLAVV